MTFFFKLNDDVLLSVVRDWLFSSADVCRFDTSLCSQNFREYILGLIAKGNVSVAVVSLKDAHEYPSKDQNMRFGFWKWLLLRNLSADTLHVRDSETFERLLKTAFIVTRFRSLSVALRDYEQLFNVINNGNLICSVNCLENFKYENCSALNNDYVCGFFLPPREFNNLLTLEFHGMYYITDKFFHVIAESCVHLLEITFISCNLLATSGLIVLYKLNQHIKKVAYRNCRMNSQDMVQCMIENCNNLESFQCDSHNEVMQPWDFFLNFPKLTTLSLSGINTTVSINTLDNIASLRTDLSLLYVSLSGITSDLSPYLAVVLSNCKLLIGFELNESVLCGDCLFSITNNCRMLQVLRILESTITGTIAQFKSVLDACDCFSDLVFETNSFVTDSFVLEVAKSLRNVKHLDFTNTLITDVSLNEIAIHCESLESLHIDQSSGLSFTEILHFIETLKRPLSYLWVSRTHLTADDTEFEAVKAACEVVGTTFTYCTVISG